jgi:hypothetical protein
MTKQTFDHLLNQLRAQPETIVWAKGKNFEEFYATCHRGDWLLWLHKRTNPKHLKIRTLVKGHCANTVRHLMKDERCIKALDAAIAFGEGKITRDELDMAAAVVSEYVADASEAATAAAVAWTDVSDTDAGAAAYLALVAAEYVGYVAYTAYAAADATEEYAGYAPHVVAHAAAMYAADAAYAAAEYVGYAAKAAKEKNQLETADIFRKYIKISDFNIDCD